MLSLALGGACQRQDAAPAAGDGIACLVPAATDMLMAMGLGSRLAGVSHHEPADGRAPAGLPRVGDYRSIDWEKLLRLRPSLLIVQYAPQKTPEGLEARARQIGARVVNVRIDTLEDIRRTLLELGDAAGDRAAAERAVAALDAELAAVRDRATTRPAPRVLLGYTDVTAGAIGRGTFLDELLQIAGGDNALDVPGYPTLDDEQVASLQPDALVLLLPGASAQVVEQARGAWSRRLPRTPIEVIDDARALLPGASAGRTAAALAGAVDRAAGRAR